MAPTAVHALADEQETDSSCPPGTVALGDFLICHAGATAAPAGAAAADAAPADAATAASAGAATIKAVSAQATRPAAKPPPAFLRPHARMAASSAVGWNLISSAPAGRSILPRMYGFLEDSARMTG